MTKYLWLALVLALFAEPAWAYIDPSRGSGLQQLLASAVVWLAALPRALRRLFGGRSGGGKR